MACFLQSNVKNLLHNYLKNLHQGIGRVHYYKVSLLKRCFVERDRAIGRAKGRFHFFKRSGYICIFRLLPGFRRLAAFGR